MTRRHQAVGKPLALPAQKEGERRREVDIGERSPAVGDERDVASAGLSPRDVRHTKDCPRGGSQSTRAERVGTAFRKGDRGAKGVGGAQKRPHVARIADPPQSKRHLAPAGREIGSSIDTDDPRRMPEGRQSAE